MVENLRMKEAFEYYYSLGDKRSLQQVAKKFTVSETSARKWSAAFNWQERVVQRDIEISKGLEKKTNTTILNEKANYRRIIKETIAKMAGVEVSNIKDLDTLVKLDLLLMGEATEKNETSIVLEGEVKNWAK